MTKPENEEMNILTILGIAIAWYPALRPQNKFFDLFDDDEDPHE